MIGATRVVVPRACQHATCVTAFGSDAKCRILVAVPSTKQKLPPVRIRGWSQPKSSFLRLSVFLGVLSIAGGLSTDRLCQHQSLVLQSDPEKRNISRRQLLWAGRLTRRCCRSPLHTRQMGLTPHGRHAHHILAAARF